MSKNIYGGRLGRIIEKFNNVSCPACQSKQVQIINYLQGDPSWKCRQGHCRQVFTLSFKDDLNAVDELQERLDYITDDKLQALNSLHVLRMKKDLKVLNESN